MRRSTGRGVEANCVSDGERERSGKAAGEISKVVNKPRVWRAHLIECEDQELSCSERVHPRAQLRLVNRLAYDACVKAARDCDALVPQPGR